MKNAEYVSPPTMQDNSTDDWLLPTIQSRGSTTHTDIIPVTAHVPYAATEAITPTGATIDTEHINETAVSPTTTPIFETSTTPTASSTPSPASPLPSSTPISPTPKAPIENQEQTSQSPGLLEVLGRGHRIKKSPVLLKNFVTHAASMTPTPHVSS